MLKEFSKAWGFEISRLGNSYCCHFAETKQKPKTASPSKQRQSKKSAKSSVKCPFVIRFSIIKQEEFSDQDGDDSIYANSGGQLQVQYAKITTAEYHPHTCKPGAESQHYARRKVERSSMHLMMCRMSLILWLMVEFGDLAESSSENKASSPC